MDWKHLVAAFVSGNFHFLVCFGELNKMIKNLGFYPKAKQNFYIPFPHYPGFGHSTKLPSQPANQLISYTFFLSYWISWVNYLAFYHVCIYIQVFEEN